MDKTVPRSRRGGDLWRHRDFSRLWAGESVSEFGSQVSLLAVPLIAVRTLDATTFQIGLLTALSTAAFLLVGLPAGVWVDRLRRRNVMIVSDVGRVVALGSIPVTYAFGALSLVQLYVVMFVAGVLTVFFDVAYQSYLPSLVGLQNISEGNAKLMGSQQVAQVAGPSVAGALIQAIGGSFAVATDAASFLVSGMAISRISAPETVLKDEVPHRLYEGMTEGLKFVFGHPLLRAIAATTATSNFSSGIMTAVEIVFLVRVVHARPDVIGLLFAAVGIGGLLAALMASRLSRRIGEGRATILGAVSGVGALLIPLATPGAGVLFFAAGYFVAAFGTVVYNINQVTFRQRLCPPRLLGRMNASMRFVVWGVTPVGALLGGAIGQSIGLRPTMWLAAIGEAVAGAWLLASPLRKMKNFPTTSQSLVSGRTPAITMSTTPRAKRSFRGRWD
ncbi:MAG: MFS transporter [Acidimicrobiales bacterium]